MNIIQTIGVQRFVKLMALLAINGVLAAGIYFYTLPEMKATTAEFNGVKGEVNRIRGDIDNIEDRFAELKENEKQYKRLLARKFISGQDRLEIRELIEQMRERSGVQTLTYSIQPIEYVQHDQSYALTEHDLIKSKVSVTTTAFIDLEILALQAMLDSEFPGQTIIENLSYKRTSPINERTLAGIGLAQTMDFMRGQIDFSWYTIAPKDVEKEGAL